MKQKEVLVLVVTVFLTVLAWVLLEVKSIREITPTEAEIDSKKLEYTVHTEILDMLSERTP